MPQRVPKKTTIEYPAARKKSTPSKKTNAPQTPKGDNDIAVKALAYIALDNQVKKLNKQITPLKSTLKSYVEKFRKKGDMYEHNSYATVLKHADREIELVMTARTQPMPKVDAIHIIKKKFPKFKNKLIATVPAYEEVDLEALENLVADGKITENEAKDILDLVTNFAFGVKVIK